MEGAFTVRRTVALLISLVLLICSLQVPVMAKAETTIIVLPTSTQVISEETFMGNTLIREVVIPESTTSIGTKAFSGCTTLEKVTISSKNVEIAEDAFEACPNVNLYVYKYSTGEAFAIEKGLSYTLIDGSEPVSMNLKDMVGEFSIVGSGLQGGDDRLIVCMNDSPLPDISAYHPVAIAQGGENVYFLQFADDDNGETDTNNCYTMLSTMLGNEVAVLQRDAVTYVTNRGEDSGSVGQAGIMTWQNDDPMGFDEYAPYVTEHQSGSQVIAVVDAGIKQSSVYNSMLYSKNYNLVPDGQGVFYSGRNHGSYIASIIHDCVGNANVKIMSVRVVDDNEETIPSIFGEGIRQAVEAGADIINISYVLPYSPYVEYELQEAASKGVKIVIAAGNYNGSTNDFFPANADINNNKIVVSGLEDADRIWSRTNTGPQVTYCAPAAGIRTSYANIGEGTSFAAPMIASAYALVSLDTTHSNSDLIASCKTDIGLNGKTNKSQAIGYGMPQLGRLAAKAVTGIVVDDIPSVMKVGDAVTLNCSVLPENATNRTLSITSNNGSIVQPVGIGSETWGAWTDKQIELEETIEVETRTLYKSTKKRYGNWGPWSYYSLEPISNSDVVGVETAPVWSWLYFPCPYCGFHMWSNYCNCAKWAGGCGKYFGASNMEFLYLPHSHYESDCTWNFSGVGTNKVRYYDSTYGWVYGQENDHNAKTGYRYRSRPVEILEDSGWQTEPITNGTAEINEYVVVVNESKLQYRYRSEAIADNTTRIKLFALKKGKTSLTLSANDESGVSRVLDIQVIQPVTAITIGADQRELKTTETLSLSVNVLPTNADNRKVTWSSSNSSVATVSTSGVVTPVSGGNVVIRAEAQDGYGTFGEISLQIIEIPDPESINIIAQNKKYGEEDTLELAPGDKVALSAVVSPAEAVQTVVWSAKSIPANANVVSIDSETGYLTAINAGSAVVTVTSTEKASISQQVSIIVRIIPEGITISGDDEIKVDESKTYTATVMPANASNKNVAWSSSNSNIASVNQNGVVTGVKNGEVDIIATSAADSTVIGRKHILVKQMPKSVSISGTVNIFINNDDPNKPAQNSSQLTATISPSDAYDKSVTWSSSNTSVVTVSASGLVTTVRPGTSIITATSKANSSIKATVTVTVKNKWSEWSAGTDVMWQDTPVSSTSTTQVEQRPAYQSTTTSYGSWGGWSYWSLDAKSGSDVEEVERENVWAWLYYPCTNCHFHMWACYCNCAGYAGGCGKYFGAANMEFLYLPHSHYASDCTWNFFGVGTNRVRYYDSTYGWLYGQESDHNAKTGYRYRTRSKNVTTSDWLTTPIEEVNTNNMIITVTTKPTYRYRTKNTF